ncbi:uncharacterized protein LOC136085869 isoform X5 [Hydra vulgaris]|uniref:Uncharacterized protein LOC136085869 isoform X5 n=1 Tax=Hydra vulgaris TaxID=6087 RepID=A0ABM4CPD6_HYDVU
MDILKFNMMVFHSLKYHGVASDQKFKIFGSILNIDNVKTVEKDEYTCNAINSVGMDSKKVKLLVNVYSPLIKVSCHTETEYQDPQRTASNLYTESIPPLWTRVTEYEEK